MAGDLVQVVLAAGRSRRMGRPKALLRFGARTALELVLEAARGGGVRAAVVVTGAGGAALRAACGAGTLLGPMDIAWAVSAAPGAEQIDSLKAGLQAVRGEPEGFFIHPVDHPLVLASDYRLLLDAFRSNRGRGRDQPAVYRLAAGGRTGHPVLCRWSLVPRLLGLPKGDTARDVLDGAPTLAIETPNAGVLEDMDTPEDYERLLELHRRLAGSG